MVQLCGDAHLSNFGFYATPERNQAFDINDFDETYPGPFEWDVKRLAASVAVAGLASGFSRKKARAAALAAVTGYRDGDPPAGPMGNLAVWYSHQDMAAHAAATSASEAGAVAEQRLGADLAKARFRDSNDALRKLCVDRRRAGADQERPAADHPGEELLRGLGLRDRRLVRPDRTADRGVPARRCRATGGTCSTSSPFVQLGFKVVGVGSVGTRA